MPSTTPLPTAPLLDVRQLAKRYGTRQAVADVSLQVAPGTLLGLLGPNGAGKSTTLSMIAGLTPADSGSVQIAGRSQADDPAAARRQIGLVTQDLALHDLLSARRNLLLFGALHGLRGAALAQRADAVLAQVGLADRRDELPQRLSGGERQRVAVARALVNNPPLVLCDEPTGSLDRDTARAVGELFIDLARRHGSILIVVTHNLELAGRCSRQLELRDGRLHPLAPSAGSAS